MVEICPRCGKPGYPQKQRIYNRYYVYFNHKENKKIKRCYIGPVEGYVAAAKLHEISIPHAFSIEHKLVVIEELLQYFTETCRHVSGDDEEGKKIKSVCEEAKKAAEEFLQNLSRPQ